MCKHVAAACYGIGARLDHSPELFFTLRQVDMNELLADNIAAAADAPAGRSTKVLAGAGLEALFGLDLGGGEAPNAIAPDRTTAAKKAAVKKPKTAVVKKTPTKVIPLKKPVDKPVRKAVKRAAAVPAKTKEDIAKKPSSARTIGKAADKPVHKGGKKPVAKTAAGKRATGKVVQKTARKSTAKKSATPEKSSGKSKRRR